MFAAPLALLDLVHHTVAPWERVLQFRGDDGQLLTQRRDRVEERLRCAEAQFDVREEDTLLG